MTDMNLQHGLFAFAISIENNSSVKLVAVKKNICHDFFFSENQKIVFYKKIFFWKTFFSVSKVMSIETIFFKNIFFMYGGKKLFFEF